ncbi:hypothetical protein AB1Y20_014478 [Prymnesium parvum]|uniref:EamA domain-containing protein n=1 Tax=Prymnesium parvum TaxID=97485 RepID=A0AB34IGF5_PRYPA
MEANTRRLDAVAVCVANVLTSVVATCLYYTELYHLRAAPAFATQLNAALQAALCALCLALLDATRLAPRRREAPVAPRAWLALALLFAAQNTLEIAAIDALGPERGSLTAVLQQAVVPITLLLCAVALRRRYGALHLLAAALVVGGVALAYLPAASAAGVPQGWLLAFVASRVPQAAANVFSEVLLERAAEAAPPRSGWDALRTVLRAGLWTAALGLLFNVPSALIVSAAKGREAIPALLEDYREGARCLLLSDGEGCGGAWVAVLAFALPGVAFAVSEFQVVQKTSAATYFLLVALQLPLEAVALSMPSIMGRYASTSRSSVLYGVPVIVGGLVCWAIAEMRRSSQRGKAACLALDTAGPAENALAVNLCDGPSSTSCAASPEEG